MDPADALVQLKKLYNRASILPLRDCCSAKIRFFLDNSHWQRNYTEWGRQSSHEGMGLYRRKLANQKLALAPKEGGSEVPAAAPTSASDVVMEPVKPDSMAVGGM